MSGSASSPGGARFPVWRGDNRPGLLRIFNTHSVPHLPDRLAPGGSVCRGESKCQIGAVLVRLMIDRHGGSKRWTPWRVAKRRPSRGTLPAPICDKPWPRVQGSIRGPASRGAPCSSVYDLKLVCYENLENRVFSGWRGGGGVGGDISANCGIF